MHTYEMDRIYSDYYFFDENCSYDLLFLLDAARPSIGLTDQFPLWVIPIDTIRKVQREWVDHRGDLPPLAGDQDQVPGLLAFPEQPEDRPGHGRGKGNRIVSWRRRLTRERKILISDLAGEYLQYQYSKKKITTAEFQERFWKILRVRSSSGGGGRRLPDSSSGPAG